MNYRSFQQLNSAILRSLDTLPGDVDLVVGVPRSGLLAANLMALHLNLPLADLEGFRAGRLLRGGIRMDGRKISFDDIRKVVILDDSLQSGHAMRVARETVKDLGFKMELVFGVVFMKPGMEHAVDFFIEKCAMPRAFEWNMLHHPGVMVHTGVEMDGVLCHEPDGRDLVSTSAYASFVENARPHLSFTGTIGLIVTNRPELYRPQTVEWLEKNGIRYGGLVMRGNGTRSHDRKRQSFGSNPELFVFFEARREEARHLASKTGKMVYAVDVREMIYPDGVGGLLRMVRRRLVSFAGRAMPTSVKNGLKELVTHRCLPALAESSSGMMRKPSASGSGLSADAHWVVGTDVADTANVKEHAGKAPQSNS